MTQTSNDVGPDASGRNAIARRIRRAGLLVILLFWVVEFAELTFASFVDDPKAAPHAFPPRFMLIFIGVAMTMGLVEANIRALGRPFRSRMIVALSMATTATALLSIANYLIFVVLMRVAPVIRWSDIVYVVFDWSWFLFSFTGAILAISHSFEVRQRDAQIADAKAIAQTAQLRALRYQLNPHFLFNTLNSIASLVRRKENGTAETMVENLSDFLRSGLELDPHEDVTLTREIELQKLYLGIEIVRFPDRLRLVFDIPDALATALVPSLITQPLIENVLKYAVAASSTAVTLTVKARRVEDRLKISVMNEGGDCMTPRSRVRGTGVGLANVAERLRVRFGDHHSVRAAPSPTGGFIASIEMPLRFA